MNKLLLILGLLSFLIGSGYARKVDLVSYPGGKCMLFRVQEGTGGRSAWVCAGQRLLLRGEMNCRQEPGGPRGVDMYQLGKEMQV